MRTKKEAEEEQLTRILKYKTNKMSPQTRFNCLKELEGTIHNMLKHQLTGTGQNQDPDNRISSIISVCFKMVCVVSTNKST